jgi:hypothetical protein
LVQEHLARPEHQWVKGLTPEEAEAVRKMYEQRYESGKEPAKKEAP